MSPATIVGNAAGNSGPANPVENAAGNSGPANSVENNTGYCQVFQLNSQLAVFDSMF